MKNTLRKRFFRWLFPEFTMWQSMEVVQGMNTFYLVQMRTNRSTGAKQFRLTPIIESHYSPKECINLSLIQQSDEREIAV